MHTDKDDSWRSAGATGFGAPLLAAVATGALVVTGVVGLNQPYRSISWATVVLVAGMITLSTAFLETGAAGLVTGALISLLGDAGPRSSRSPSRQASSPLLPPRHVSWR